MPARSSDTTPATCDPPPAPPDIVADVLAWLVEGHTDAHVKAALAHLHPDENPDRILAAVSETLRQDGETDPQMVRGWAMRCYRDLYRRQLEIGDFDGCRKSLKELVALAG